MTTLESRPTTALLVVDGQNGVLERAHARDAAAANAGRSVEKARRERVPVVWVRHADGLLASGSESTGRRHGAVDALRPISRRRQA
jgi:nicotinamidase-related amidase